jgi:hypothetical protein
MRFKVFMAAKIKILVFWAVTPCGPVERYQHSEKHTSALKMESVCSSKIWYLSVSPHSITTQKTNIDTKFEFVILLWMIIPFIIFVSNIYSLLW